jgi:putative PIN family toxin of toxin-antitoxin system
VVLDTSVIATAFRSRNGASFALLNLVAKRLLVPLLTPALFLQYQDVLKRPEQLVASRLTSAQVDQRLAAMAVVGEAVTVHFLWRPQLPDPGDELVLEAALNGRADALVTYDIRHVAGAATRFGPSVVRPAEVLEELIR